MIYCCVRVLCIPYSHLLPFPFLPLIIHSPLWVILASFLPPPFPHISLFSSFPLSTLPISLAFTLTETLLNLSLSPPIPPFQPSSPSSLRPSSYPFFPSLLLLLPLTLYPHPQWFISLPPSPLPLSGFSPCSRLKLVKYYPVFFPL